VQTPRSARSLLLGLTAAVAACAPAAAPPPRALPAAPVAAAPPPAAPAAGLDGFAPGAAAAAAGIRPEALAAHIRFLADDLLAGREPGTPGFEIAARYVASELQALGVQPAGDDGTYFQKVEMTHSSLVSTSLDVIGGAGPVLKFQRDVDLVAHKLPIDRTAEMVFVGHGLDIPEYHYDDFAGVDLHGKIVVRFGRAPRSDRADFFPPLASAIFGDTERITADLKRRGAIAVIQVQTPEMARTYPFPFLVQNGRFPSITLAHQEGLLPGGRMDYTALDRMLKKAGRTETATQLADAAEKGPTRAFSLGKAHLRVEVKQHPIVSENVAGFVPSDPTSPTNDEIVMYGAHLDHMGIGDEVKGDRIYNGASDDAAGVSSLLETARAFTRLAAPPKRKILFLFVTGEERGLLGSEYFSFHPTVPLHDIVADIDLDDAYPTAPIKDVVPLGTEESTLRTDAARAAAALGLQMGPDPHPEQFFFVRSDQYSFVKQGIPAAQILRGEGGMSDAQKKSTAEFWKGRYHQPQDEYEPNRDWRPFAEMVRYDFLLGLSIAQRADRPTWNANSVFRRFPEKGAR
jgi:hypothetical protein